MLQLLALSGASTPVASEVLGAEELEIYGYVGKETAIFKTGASARDIANSVNAWKVKLVCMPMHQLMLE